MTDPFRNQCILIIVCRPKGNERHLIKSSRSLRQYEDRHASRLPHSFLRCRSNTHLLLTHQQQLGLLHVGDAVIGSFFIINSRLAP